MKVFRRLFSRKDEPREQIQASGQFDTVEQGDRMIVKQLRSLGADLSLPRTVRHYLYLPTDAAATAVSEELRGDGFMTEVRPAAGPPGPNPWLVLATTEAVVSVDFARAAREAFSAIADTHGGEYDGWEAAGSP